MKLASLAAAFLAVACSSAPATPTPNHEAATPVPVAAAAAEKGKKKYGGDITMTEAIPFTKLLANAEQYTDKEVLVDGTVRQVCTKKGCWMELAGSGEKGSQGCRVTFKDYGFFVPTDSQGTVAKVQGTLSTSIVSKDDVAHYEAEGATFATKLADGSAKELKLVATAVQLTRL